MDIPQERTWSEQQSVIFGEFREGKDNVVVRARAGTGKTTTILEGINHAPESSVLLAAFNKSIAEELKTKLKNPRAQAKTLHSIGFGLVLSKWEGTKLDTERGERLAKKVTGGAPDPIVTLVKRLASLGKGMCPFPKDGELEDIAYEFDIVPDESQQSAGFTMEAIAGYAVLAMEAASKKDGTIDFDDMIFVPVRNQWARGKYGLVVIDECQDMNASQILLAIGVCAMNGRIFVVGDDRQAIYAFRGADSGSLDRLKKQLAAKELGLTTTYRCPSSIVDLARVLVPDYRAAPTAPKGEVTTVDFEKLHELANPGDFVLSRKNAPLAKVCLRLLRHGKRAMIEGKDLGRSLLTVVKNLRARSIPDFMERLTVWEDRTTKRLMATKKKSAEARCEVVRDQAECLRALAEGVTGVKQLTDRIDSLFTETPNGKADYIVCSSVHRSKGRERDNVYFLQETLYPGGRQDLEEQNIHYVGMTRAKKKLIWVTGIS